MAKNNRLKFDKDKCWDNLLEIMNQQPQQCPSDFFRISKNTRDYLEHIYNQGYEKGFEFGTEINLDINQNFNKN